MHGPVHPLRWLAGAAVLAVAVVAAVVAWPRPAAAIEPLCQVTGATGTYRLDLEQAANATTIAVTAKEMGLPDHAVTVAIEAALQESRLHNIDYGDRDSLGLFQQRPSQGWGTREQILDARYAAARFLEHLARVPNWATRAVDDAAQAVQHSGAPHAYTQWERAARTVASAITGERPVGLGCQFPDVADPPTTSSIHRAVVAAWGHDPLDRPVGSPRGWLVASWMVGNAQRLGIRTVTFSGYRWTSSSHRWEHTGPVADRVRIGTTT